MTTIITQKKEVTKNIKVFKIEDVKNGFFDLGIIINGVDLINMELDEGIKILNDHNLIKDGWFIIPKGLELTKVTQYGGAWEYNFNDGFIITDLAFDGDEDQYIA